MINRRLCFIAAIFCLLAACGSTPPSNNVIPPVATLSAFTQAVTTDVSQNTAVKLLQLAPEHRVYHADGDFVSGYSTQQFINNMVSQYGFDRQQLIMVLSQARKLDYVIALMDKQAPVVVSSQPKAPPKPNGAWLRYRKKFITPQNVQRGVDFWNSYQQALSQAEKKYGVPAEIVVGIIGIETGWGRITGKTRVIDALATLAFAYPRRADYFSQELTTYLLISRQEEYDPLSVQGSFAGAMGYGQFMPSSYQQYAVDFDGDGHINLWDPVDAIGSVAHYFQQHGWQSGETVAIAASGQVSGLETGFATRYTPNQLAKAGLTPLASVADYPQVSLLQLDMGDSFHYWYGLQNFYVITRYNHSNYYAMAAWQLGQAVKQARQQK